MVVTGNELKLGFNEYSKELSELTFSMGVKLPLAEPEEIPQWVDNQSIAGNYVVKLPVRTASGRLQFKLALVSAANDVNEGYLPYTRANIIRQAFKMQGQRYGWGGSFNGRDCSAFVKDIYAVFGFNLPRNAGEQKNSAGKTFLADANADLNLRKELLSQVTPGATIHMPGHVMLYLGEERGRHYVIHNISAQGDQQHKLSNGNLPRLPINQITVTDLSITKTNGKHLMELWSALKQLEQ